MFIHAGALRGQNRASHPLRLQFLVVVGHHCRCWESNSEVLQEQLVILTRSSLQPIWLFLYQILCKVLSYEQRELCIPWSHHLHLFRLNPSGCPFSCFCFPYEPLFLVHLHWHGSIMHTQCSCQHLYSRCLCILTIDITGIITTFFLQILCSEL